MARPWAHTKLQNLDERRISTAHGTEDLHISDEAIPSHAEKVLFSNDKDERAQGMAERSEHDQSSAGVVKSPQEAKDELQPYSTEPTSLSASHHDSALRSAKSLLLTRGPTLIRANSEVIRETVEAEAKKLTQGTADVNERHKHEQVDASINSTVYETDQEESGTYTDNLTH